MPTSPIESLFTPATMGDLRLKNRVVYPAMTRARCATRVVNDEQVKYYRLRASAGLIVTEPSSISPEANGYGDTPGLYTEEQSHAWSKVTNALHAEGCSAVVAQLWHTGRMSHSTFHDGKQIVSASALRIEDVNGVPACGVQGADGAWYDHETPRALTTAEVEEIVAAFGKSASLAKAAGFDGIEIHAGSGYLVDTFLQACSNVRDDKYGGDAAGRFTILAEILDAVAKVFPLSCVGIKLSPNNGFNGMGSEETAATFLTVARRLNEMGVAYLHVADGVGNNGKDATWYGRVDSVGFHGYGSPVTLPSLREVFKGAIIANGGYTRETAAAAVATGDATAVSFGRAYMANPDLALRFRDGLPLSPLPPKAFWFEPSKATRADVSKGYTEYGAYTSREGAPAAESPKSPKAAEPETKKLKKTDDDASLVPPSSPTEVTSS